MRRTHRPLLKALTVVPVVTLALAYCRDGRAPTEAPAAAPASLVVAGAALTDGPAVLVGASDIGTCTTNNDEATAKLLDAIPGTIMMLGDAAYVAGSPDEFANCYGTTWGRHLARTRPALGERDLGTTPDGSTYYNYFGAAAGDPATGYYSYDLGEWHVVVMNSESSLKVDSPQLAWLRADLAANPRACTVAYWHQPRFYSGTPGYRTAIEPLWDVLYAAGVDVVVNGHTRFYERYAPQNNDEVADPGFGIRQFIVGVGGAGTSAFTTLRPNSQVLERSTYGVLKLTLGSGTYDWQFVPIAGKTFTDAGTDICHAEPPPIADPGGPYFAEALTRFDGSGSRDLQDNTPLTYAWNFGDGATGTGVAPSHTYVADGVYTVSLTVTDALGTVSPMASTTVTIANLAPLVSEGLDRTATTGTPFSLPVNFTDANVRDAPWAYVINWGDGTKTATGTVSEQGVPFSRNHNYGAAGDYKVTVSVTDAELATGVDDLIVRVRAPGTTWTFIGAGDIAKCGTDPEDAIDEATAKLLDAYPTATVFALGDNAYPDGTAADYANCYAPTWGRHKARTYAALGNHEYDTGTADAAYDYFGERVGPRGKGYYSFDLGEWHIVVLNDNYTFVPIAAGSEQDNWLVDDLARSRKRCTMAIFHQTFVMSSDIGHIWSSSRKIIWDRLYANGVDVVLGGHHHHYERFAPQNPDRVRDDALGIRQFIVGTGGEEGNMPTIDIAPNSQVRGGAAGVLKFTLRDTGYDWQFIPVAGSTFKDSGSSLCH